MILERSALYNTNIITLGFSLQYMLPFDLCLYCISQKSRVHVVGTRLYLSFPLLFCRLVPDVDGAAVIIQ